MSRIRRLFLAVLISSSLAGVAGIATATVASAAPAPDAVSTVIVTTAPKGKLPPPDDCPTNTMW